jgi:energy-coupling factor transport system ATP-binding protein
MGWIMESHRDNRDYVVEVRNLRFRYISSKIFALDGISFRVKKGEFFTIMGRNGAGKTTLALCLAGVIPHYIEGDYEGKVMVDGMDVASSTIPEVTSKLGLILQDPEDQVVGVTVRDDVAFGPCNLGLSKEVVLERIKSALKMVRLNGYEERETHTLSGGEKQRLAIAGILALGTNIIVADEPTCQLDPVGKKEVFETLLRLNKTEGKTIIMITHETDLAMKYSHRIGLLDSGKFVVVGSPRELLLKLGIEGLTQYGIRPPHVPHLFYKLFEKGMLSRGSSPWLDVEEAVYELGKLIVRNPSKSSLEDAKPSSECYHNEAIIIENLWYVYPNGVEALKGVSLQICEGEFVAIVGPNGSGKTTLIKHFNGLLKPTRGHVYIFGINTKDTSISTLSRFVGYVFQNPDHQIFASSVKEEIVFGLRNLGCSKDEIEERVEEALDFVGLKGLENEHPLRLSKAERQLVAFASVIAARPKIIVLDEPTAGLDWPSTCKVMNMLKKLNERGHTVIVVTHDMNIVAEHAKRIIILCGGRIFMDGEPRKILYDIENLSQVYIEPPIIVQLMNRLKEEYDVALNVLTVEEAANTLCKIIRGER